LAGGLLKSGKSYVSLTETVDTEDSSHFQKLVRRIQEKYSLANSRINVSVGDSIGYLNYILGNNSNDELK
jgi:hypothetical protein